MGYFNNKDDNPYFQGEEPSDQQKAKQKFEKQRNKTQQLLSSINEGISDEERARALKTAKALREGPLAKFFKSGKPRYLKEKLSEWLDLLPKL